VSASKRELQRRIALVLGDHAPAPTGGSLARSGCRECGFRWPCRTVLRLTGQDAGEPERAARQPGSRAYDRKLGVVS
jgi:hypothetical protein